MLSGFLHDWRLISFFGMLLVGCNRAPAGVAEPELDPQGSTDRVFTEYDANADQKLSRDELTKSPGLLAALSSLDRDRDGAIASDELKASLERFQAEGAGLVTISCMVTRGGQPLEGAKVELVPESFLGGIVKPASGVTGPDGTATISVDESEIPEEYRGRIHGVPTGIFRVVVTHPTIAIPAKFNTQTQLGRIVTRRDHETLTINL
jgi:hypothetical protein